MPVAGTLRLESTETSHRGPRDDGSCEKLESSCTPRTTPVTGSVRVTMREGVVRLSQLKYRTIGSVGCARDIPAVRAVLPGEPRLERLVVRDTAGRLGDRRFRRVTVSGRANPSTELTGEVRGRVRAAVRWTLVLARR